MNSTTSEDGEAGQQKLWVWASRGIQAQFDQAIVSGTSFVVIVLIGRFAGPGELGVYSLGFSILLLTMATQESLVSTPYLLRGVNLTKQRRRVYAANSLMMSVLLGLVLAVFLAMVGLVGRSWIPPAMANASLVLAVVISFFLVRIFWRRFELAHERPGMALTLDIIVALVHLSLLLGVASQGALNAATGLMALGVACVFASCTWFFVRRREILIRWSCFLEDARQSWHLGKWILASHLTMMLSVQAVLWILVLLIDETATGLFAAPLTMVMIINPFVMGLINVFLPASASALASGRIGEVRSNVRLLAFVLVPLMACFLGLVIVFGPKLMPMIYGGEYAGHDLTLILLGVTVVLRTLGIPANIGLWVFERTKENFYCGAIGFIITMTVTLSIVPRVGVVGAAIGLVAGDAMTLGFRWWRWTRSKSTGVAATVPPAVRDEI